MRSPSIFGSGVERETFLAIRKKWEREVDVFPQVPVKNVVGFSRVQSIPENGKKQYLLQTEFDYVVCKKNRGTPILVIEFDGIGGGFSRDLRYETRVVPIRDRHRSRKLQAKLDICADAGIPAVVVSMPEQERIGEDDHLTILDGIIGEVLASHVFENILKTRTFRSIDEVEDLEIELTLRKNPFNRAICGALAALLAADQGAGMRAQKPLYDRESEGMIGCHTTVGFSDRQFDGTAYVRDINCQGFVAYGLVEGLSELAALKAAIRASDL
jgi:hypothetical protein